MRTGHQRNLDQASTSLSFRLVLELRSTALYAITIMNDFSLCRAFPASSEKFFLLRDLVKTPTQSKVPVQSSGPSSSSSVEASHLFSSEIPEQEVVDIFARRAGLLGGRVYIAYPD
ncbi:hypothetical protein FPOA_04050 [Fusarium poae]|uniref:Uncharacterized protein n=1 Tax=Fusarium poae TaxID=36050 RepID=A0A1B8ASN9_FUSPO|nr:hypothetical protein FPOA_04050 [Fusarium poae]